MAAYQAGRHARPTGGFELWAWFFMRISGLVLVVLALGHLVVMHILNSVETINYEFVAHRWSDPGGYIWRIWDLLMINLAVLHGFNGLRQVLAEHVVRSASRKAVATLIGVVTIFLMLMGTYAILMFEPDTHYINRDQAARARVIR